MRIRAQKQSREAFAVIAAPCTNEPVEHALGLGRIGLPSRMRSRVAAETVADVDGLATQMVGLAFIGESSRGATSHQIDLRAQLPLAGWQGTTRTAPQRGRDR